MIEIDGSQGEGGGQVLRTSLALSMVTGQPFRINHIRAGRAKPGLMRQHLTSVEAARSVCSGRAVGASIGATSLEFTPGRIGGGDYSFAIGTAGSTALVLQTILPALITADEPSTITISGGTHNNHAPSVQFLQRSFIPLLNRMGPTVRLELERYGFYPAGGGQIRVDIQPIHKLKALNILDATSIKGRRAIITIAGLSPSIATRERDVLKDTLEWPDECMHIHQLKDNVGPGNIISVDIERENLTEVFTGFGERGVSSEKIARNTAREVNSYLKAGVPIWGHLADQLMLPLALAGSGCYRTGPLTGHATTNAAVIETFLPTKIHHAAEDDGSVRVSIV